MLLGRLFKHLHRKEQVHTFLSAVVDNRLKRIADCQRAERRNPTTLSFPVGVEHARYLKSTVQHSGSDGLASLTEEVRSQSDAVFLVLIVCVAVHPKYVLL